MANDPSKQEHEEKCFGDENQRNRVAQGGVKCRRSDQRKVQKESIWNEESKDGDSEKEFLL